MAYTSQVSYMLSTYAGKLFGCPPRRDDRPYEGDVTVTSLAGRPLSSR
jgi:hypothetical protein